MSGPVYWKDSFVPLPIDLLDPLTLLIVLLGQFFPYDMVVCLSFFAATLLSSDKRMAYENLLRLDRPLARRPDK